MIPRIRQIRPMANYRLLVDFDEGLRVVWNDRIDLPSDTIREYGGEVRVA